MRPFDSSRVIQIRYSSALSILIYFDFLELFSLILTLPASLAYLLTCGSAAVERGGQRNRKTMACVRRKWVWSGQKKVFPEGGGRGSLVLCSSSPARERGTGSCTGSESALWSQRARGVEVAGAHPPVSPPARCFFSRRGSLTSSSLSLMSFLRSSIPSICLPSTGPSFLSSSDSVGCGSSIPQSQSGYSESGRIVGSAPP